MELAKNRKNVAPVWPGTPVPLEELMTYLDAVMTPERLAAHQHYAYASRGDAERSAELLCTLRLCWFDLPRPLTVRAAFDGVQSERNLYDGDIFIGGYNGFNQVAAIQSAVYSGFSIIFHLSHIRLHYGSFDHGRALKNIYYHTRRPASGVLALLIEALGRVIHEAGEPRQERCRALLGAILQQLKHELTRESAQSPTRQDKLAMQLKNYLEHNFSRDIDCSSVSDALAVNRSYASDIFHRVFGVTMKHYLISLRLEAAQALLTSEEHLKIDDVARLCAFSSVSYFIKVFRKRYGLSPGEYRLRRGKE